MRHIISDPLKDPLGAVVSDYAAGMKDAAAKVFSPDLDMWEMSGQVMFRTFSRMNRIERKALQMCRGHILDVGAGAGCHALYLDRKQKEILPIDISPGCVQVMQQQGLSRARHCNLFSLEGEQFDTVLMLMNGIGICGDLDGLNLFFQFLPDILSPGGCVLADSTDLGILYPDLDTDDPEYGQTTFTMKYGHTHGDPFDWIYIDFERLCFYAGLHGLACEKILQDKSGKYLARISLG